MANLIYTQPEADVKWQDTSGDLAITLNNLATVAGRQGAVKDYGDLFAKSPWYEWRFFCQFATTPVVNETVEIYLKYGGDDTPHYDNDDGTGDIAVSSINKLKNLTLIGILTVDEAATGVIMSKSGIVRISARRVMPVIWNATVDNLVATDNLNGFSLTPVPDEIQ